MVFFNSPNNPSGTIYTEKEYRALAKVLEKHPQIYILSEDELLQPMGVVGEICISGDGLSRGYLNQPALTKEKFVFNRFRESGTLYKTGDLGRWLPDGNIEFIRFFLALPYPPIPVPEVKTFSIQAIKLS